MTGLLNIVEIIINPPSIWAGTFSNYQKEMINAEGAIFQGGLI